VPCRRDIVAALIQQYGHCFANPWLVVYEKNAASAISVHALHLIRQKYKKEWILGDDRAGRKPALFNKAHFCPPLFRILARISLQLDQLLPAM
jgi:hypothetical protein